MSDFLAAAYPVLGKRLPKVAVADLPTPVSAHLLTLPVGNFGVFIKHDEATSSLYGGNKVRKLEYLLQRARDRGARRIATFGAAGSNHALATAMHATALNFDCTCFLSHQRATANIPRTLNMHRQLGTEVVAWARENRLSQYRQYLQHRNAWVIPLGGTCWLGAAGFVNAGLELAQQITDGLIDKPARIYIACGTTGSAAGLALGLAAAGLDTVVHAIQVADNPFSSEQMMRKLVAKTQMLLNRLDANFVGHNAQERVVWRDAFLAGGYAKVDDATASAVSTANRQLGLALESTYTGKAMAAMLQDLQASDYEGEPYLFWNTYNASTLRVDGRRPDSLDNIPAEFARYYDQDMRVDLNQ